MVCWVRRPTGSWEGVIPGSFRMCGLCVRVGLVPASRTVGRLSDGTCGKRRRRLAGGDEPRWYGGLCRCRLALWGRSPRRGGPEGSGSWKCRRGTSAGVTPEGPRPCGRGPSLSVAGRPRPTWPAARAAAERSEQALGGERRAGLGPLLAVQPPGEVAVRDVAVRFRARRRRRRRPPRRGCRARARGADARGIPLVVPFDEVGFVSAALSRPARSG